MLTLTDKDKRAKITNLLKETSIFVDSFTDSYLEKASSEKLDLVIRYIDTGEYLHSLCVEGYIKDMLVGNITSLQELSRK